MSVEIRQVGYEFLILINGASLSYYLPTLESALREVHDIFEEARQ